METFNRLFARMLVFAYHCFDRVVINGYLSMLSRPENVVYFFRHVAGVPRITKETLMERTQHYQAWVEAYALNHGIPIEWAEKKVRKENQMAPLLKRMERQNRYGVYFIYKSMEQGCTFRCQTPKFPTKDPNHTFLRKTRSRFTHDYFYLRDPQLGPMIVRIASFLPFQTTYYINGHHFLEAELNQTGIPFRKKDNAFLDFFLKKGIQHLAAIRTHFLPITNRFASFEAQALQVPVDFPLFQRLALPIVSGSTKIPGIKIHDTRVLRLMEVLIHSGASISSWRTQSLHQTLLKTFGIQSYTLTQLRYDLRKMKAHGLVQRDSHHYCYRLTDKGIKVSLLFLLFHKRICGPIANSLFHFRPTLNGHPKSKLESAYHKADKAVQNMIELLAA